MQFMDYTMHVRVANFIYRVYGWMAFGLAVTAGVAYYVASSPTLITHFKTSPGLIVGIFLLQIALVVVLSWFLEKLSTPMAIALFTLYAASVGFSLSILFLVYTAASIYSTFIITAGMFAVMALYGYTTKTDLTKVGNIAFMALFGLIIGLLVNFFTKSQTFDLVLSGIGVVVFTALTAYDTQKIKLIGQQMIAQGHDEGKVSIMGALILYLDFINLFLFLLRFTGRQRD